MTKARSGSAMSTKQLARTAIDGRLVSFRFPFGSTVQGYLCGMDDFHWMIVTSQGEKQLIHKGSASVIHLAEESTYTAEPLVDDLEKIVGPFRTAMEAVAYGRQPVPASN